MARRRKNPSGGQIALAAGAALIASLAAYDAFAKPKAKPKKKKKPACDPSPYTFDENRVRVGIEALVGAGERDKVLIASEVDNQVFGDYPGGGNVEFPPAPGAPKGVTCVWQLTLNLVDVIFEEQGIDPDAKEDFEWEVHGSGDPGYPWESPTLHPENYPTPSTFIDIGTVDAWDTSKGFDSMVQNVLGSALAMAGMDAGLAVGNSSTSKRLRREMRELIICSKYNDALYGQTDVKKAGGAEGKDWMMNSKGRGLNWLPYHADNIGRMAQGKPPRRATSTNGKKLGGGKGGSSQMLVWLPAVDLGALQGAVPSVKALQWSDASATTEPPPVVQRLGVDMSGVNLPGGAGC